GVGEGDAGRADACTAQSLAGHVASSIREDRGRMHNRNAAAGAFRFQLCELRVDAGVALDDGILDQPVKKDRFGRYPARQAVEMDMSAHRPPLAAQPVEKVAVNVASLDASLRHKD